MAIPNDIKARAVVELSQISLEKSNPPWVGVHLKISPN
jgi:hypothetical protein